MFHFVWLRQYEAFDAVRHARQDAQIFHFDIDHQEGGVPLLRLTVAASLFKTQKPGQRGVLWQETEAGPLVLFEGGLNSDKAQSKGEFLLLVLEAGKLDKPDQLARGVKGKKRHGFDPLLMADGAQEDVDEILEAQRCVPHWSRVSGKLTFSDMLEASETIDIDDAFFADSLRVRDRGHSLSGVRFSLTAEWVQRHDGVVDLAPLLKEKGTRGHLSSLTADDFQKKWWRPSYGLMRTGYEILESGLQEVLPPSTGGLDVYPRQSAAFSVGGISQTVPRIWLEPHLKLQWHYRQKRKEVVHMEVPFGGSGPLLDIPIRLQDISSKMRIDAWMPKQIYYEKGPVVWEGYVYHCKQTHLGGAVFETEKWTKKEVWPRALEDPSSWTFFQTKRGRQVLEHVLARAESYGAMAARRLEVRFRLPFERAVGLSCDCLVRVADPRLPGGQVVGKVIHYRLIVEGDTGEKWAEVTLGVCDALPQKRRVKDMILTSDVSGIRDPKTVTAQDLVENISLIRPAEIQNETIQEKDFPSRGAAHHVLEKVPTRLRIALKDLRTSACLTHVWRVGFVLNAP
jgi:hypothetical protein